MVCYCLLCAIVFYLCFYLSFFLLFSSYHLYHCFPLLSFSSKFFFFMSTSRLTHISSFISSFSLSHCLQQQWDRDLQIFPLAQIPAAVPGPESCDGLVWLLCSRGEPGDPGSGDNPPLSHPYSRHRDLGHPHQP